LSSAILYVAIVAIWACVLIPRWLRRDSAVPSPSSEEQAADQLATDQFATAAETDEEQAAPARRRRFRRADRQDAAEERDPVLGESRRVPEPSRRVPEPSRRVPEPSRYVPDPSRRVPEPSRYVPDPSRYVADPSRRMPASGGDPDVPDDRPHHRVLSARRRLLAMLVVLTMAAGALAYTKLAAWWVILPPSVMLLGYLVLLREAGKADVDRRERALSAAAEGSDAVGAVPAARAEIIDLSTSRGPRVHAGHEVQAGPRVQARQELYDQDEDAKLRAVGN
jgi:hypothetical protein